MTKPQVPFTDYKGIASALRLLHDRDGLSWPQIAAKDENGPEEIVYWRIANDGYEPKKWRAYFGLPVIGSAPVCSVHHVVHCYDCAVETVKTRRPKKTGWKSLFDIPHEGKNSELAKMVTERQVVNG